MAEIVSSGWIVQFDNYGEWVTLSRHPIHPEAAEPWINEVRQQALNAYNGEMTSMPEISHRLIYREIRESVEVEHQARERKEDHGT